MSNKLPMIEFEGKRVKPSGAGFYRCPFKCGRSDYSQPKWKTERGFRKHMSSCHHAPSRVADRKRHEIQRDNDNKEKARVMLAKCTRKIGETIFHVQEVITKPTHVPRFSGYRMVRVRYEAEKRFYARESIIESISACHYEGIVYNGHIREISVVESYSIAEKTSAEKQVNYDEGCRAASMLR